jgi:signal transduction histidine kinase
MRELEADVSALAQAGFTHALISKVIQKNNSLRQTQIEQEFNPKLSSHGYLAFAVIRPNGVQVAPLLGTDTDQRRLYRQRKETIVKAFRGEFSLGTPQVSPEFSRPVMIAVSPVKDNRGKVIAALTIYIDPEHSFTQMTRLGRIGTSGETYAVDRNGRMITQSRFSDRMQLSNLFPERRGGISLIEIRDPGGNMLDGFKVKGDRDTLPYTKMAKEVMAGRSGIDLSGYRDYRGVTVIGGWLWNDHLGFGLATEIDRNEAYRSLDLTQHIFWMLVAALVIGSTALLFILRAMAQARQIGYAGERANRARQELLAIVSHDLKNPLTSILMIDEILINTLLPGEDSDRRHKLLESLRGSAQQMNRLIDDLQFQAKSEAGKLAIHMESLKTETFVNQMVSVFEPIANAKKIILKAKVDPNLPDCWGDWKRLRQVVSNILGNALKFTPAGGTVTIHAVQVETFVRFSIEDTGPGISPENVPKVFEKYWQVKETERKGMGLGLAIAKEIVQGHGGQIWVESILGKGTTFHFTIPSAQNQAAVKVS